MEEKESKKADKDKIVFRNKMISFEYEKNNLSNHRNNLKIDGDNNDKLSKPSS